MHCKFSKPQCIAEGLVSKIQGLDGLCAYHARLRHRYRVRMPKVVGFEDHMKRMENARLRKAKSRWSKKIALQATAGTEIGRICAILTKMKDRHMPYVLVDNVIDNLPVKSLKLAKSAEGITFTDEKAPTTRTMTDILNPTVQGSVVRESTREIVREKVRGRERKREREKIRYSIYLVRVDQLGKLLILASVSYFAFPKPSAIPKE